jgi:hypothetical protein
MICEYCGSLNEDCDCQQERDKEESFDDDNIDILETSYDGDCPW